MGQDGGVQVGGFQQRQLRLSAIGDVGRPASMVPVPRGGATGEQRNVVAAASASSVAARTVRDGDGRERKNSCMMIDLCTDLQKKQSRACGAAKGVQLVPQGGAAPVNRA